MALRRGLTRTACALLLLAAVAPATAPAHASGDGYPVPEQVVSYFEHDLVPRLADLYTPGADPDSGITFDETTSVGTIVRLSAWRQAFLADAGTPLPTEVTNQWVAPVRVGDTIAGAALVWINPGLERAELAEFYPGVALAASLESLPVDSVLVRHQPSESFFVVHGEEATPILAGSTSVAGTVPLDSIPRVLGAGSGEAGSDAAPLVPAIVLVVSLVAIAWIVTRSARARRHEPIGTRSVAGPRA